MDKCLYLADKNGAVITTLRERDGITGCTVDLKQNGESGLEFSMLVRSEKYKLVTADAERLIIADGKVYTRLYDGDGLVEKKDSGNRNSAVLSFVERQYLLGKQYLTAYNSTTTYDHIDTNMVVILSGGIDELVVNGEVVNNPYEKGSAAYALYAVLYGSGWSVGTVDVTGVFDLESDKQSVLDNIKAIAELWGGILIFDSFQKIVHLRSETAFRPYNGYKVKFSFNETGLERSINSNIVTRLYVYGKDNLNIAASNGGKEYLENYSYTSTPLYGMAVNNDISNVGDLILWGEQQLEKLCRPQVCLKVSIVDRSQLDGGVTFDVSDIVDVEDTDLSESKYQARVTGKSYDFYQPWNCTVTLGDEEEVFAAKVKYALKSADKVNDLTDLFGRISSDSINMAGSKQTMTSYVQLTNKALEAGFKVVGVDGYERTGKTTISAEGIEIYNGGVVIRDRDNNVKVYMDGETGNIIFAGDLYGASGTFKGKLEAASGTFKGALEAATGDFSGKITAQEGYIGTWQIVDGGIINIDNTLALTADGEIVAASGNFEVDSDGILTANGAKLTGDFSATSGGSAVKFTEKQMLIDFANYSDETGLITSACRISPTEFYFIAYDEAGQIQSAIEYKNGQLELTGKIIADSGEIGGWLIDGDKIKAVNGSMVLYADGSIEGTSDTDLSSGTKGTIISQSAKERTVIKGGRISFYHWKQAETDDKGNVITPSGWEREASIYTNENFDGGACIESVADRPIVFGMGGMAIAKILPEIKNDEGKVTQDAQFVFRLGTTITRTKVESRNFISTGEIRNLKANDDLTQFTYNCDEGDYAIDIEWDGNNIKKISQNKI